MSLRIRIPREDNLEYIWLLRKYQEMPKIEKIQDMCRYADHCEWALQNPSKISRPIQEYEDGLKFAIEEIQLVVELRRALFIVPFEKWPFGFQKQIKAGIPICETPQGCFDMM
jgi:hypothetical protein